MNDQADDNAEQHRGNNPRQPDLNPQNPNGQNNREHIDGRTGVQKGDRRSQTGAPFIDAGKQRQNGTTAHGQDRPGDG